MKAGGMKKAAMKAMKAKKAGSVMKKAGMKKAMKAKRVSIVAHGARAKSSVFSGRKEKTSGGVTKAGLVKNKSGKVVSKKMSAQGKKVYARTIKAWADACKAARKALGVKGFVPMGGKSAAGRALYAKAKSIMAA